MGPGALGEVERLGRIPMFPDRLAALRVERDHNLFGTPRSGARYLLAWAVQCKQGVASSDDRGVPEPQRAAPEYRWPGRRPGVGQPGRVRHEVAIRTTPLLPPGRRAWLRLSRRSVGVGGGAQTDIEMSRRRQRHQCARRCGDDRCATKSHKSAMHVDVSMLSAPPKGGPHNLQADPTTEAQS